ncbi:hypothetical protein [Nocardia africana]
MPTPEDHRTEAARALFRIPGLEPTDTAAFATTATAHALLALEARLGEQLEVQRQQLEQQRLANVLTAFGTASEESLINYSDLTAAEKYVRDRIGAIVKPAPESENDR